MFTSRPTPILHGNGVSHRILPKAQDSLGFLTARQRRLVVDGISLSLAFQPTVSTHNRKRLRTNLVATWELRTGDLRVYYDVQEGADPAVQIALIGVKRRDAVYVGGRRFELI